MSGNTRVTPPRIKLEEVVFDVAFHPTASLIATGLITGAVSLYEYSPKENEEHPMDSEHESSCRAIDFSADGLKLYTASSDASIQHIDVIRGAVVHRREESHRAPINCLTVLDNGLLASGDDEGNIRMWDVRDPKIVDSYNAHDQFVASLTTANDTLLAAGGDGRLSAHDLKTKSTQVSDQVEYGLTCLAVVRSGTKVVCGAENGTMPIFSVGRWGDMSDRVVDHPSDISIDAMVRVDDDLLCIGSMDGGIRAVNVFPNRVAGRIGVHRQAVEALALSSDGELLASCGQDKTVRFWNAGRIRNKRNGLFRNEEDDDDEDEDEDEDEEREEGEEEGQRGGAKRDEQTAAAEEGTGRSAGDAGDAVVGELEPEHPSKKTKQGSAPNADDNAEDEPELEAAPQGHVRVKKKSKAKQKRRGFFDDL